MRTEDEQLQGLLLVAKDVFESEIIHAPGDVVALRLGYREVVYAVDDYDGWENQAIVKADMTREQATAWLRGD